MSALLCPLVWKAAALQDGRLEGPDVMSFELHATRCADCRAEWKAIASSHEAARAMPFVDPTPLAHARQRAALLARANERFLRPPRGWRPWGLTLLGAAAVAAAAAFVVGRAPAPLPRPAHATSTTPLSAPRCEVVASERALWRAQTDGTTARVDVADGEATLLVGPMLGAQRALIHLPDGEIEPSPARFVVDVALGRTRSVKVLEGQVVLRLREAEPTLLDAGDGWPRTTAAVATHVEGGTPALERPTAVNGARAAPPGPATPPSSSAASATTGARRTHHASAMFDEAISSFVHASYGQADRELRDFIADFPEDSRCEDAAFLSTVSRWRMGDVPGARARAASYLKTYPNGLRRAEAQQIIDAR